MIQLQNAMVYANQQELVLGVLVKTETPFMSLSITASASFSTGTSLSL